MALNFCSNSCVDLEELDTDLDSAEEEASQQKKPRPIGKEPAYSETVAAFDKQLRHNYRFIAYHEGKEGELEFLDPIKKARMQIKDIVKEHVLPYLPAKVLMKLRSVSKQWDQWISSPFLAHKQSISFRDMSGFFWQATNMSLSFVTLYGPDYGVSSPFLDFLPEDVEIISSSNGLLLCRGLNEDNYYVCNPVTEELKVLPLPNYYHGSRPAAVLIFEPSWSNIESNYQIICAVPLLDQPIIVFEIYCSDTKSWRSVSEHCVELLDSDLKADGFYIDGMVYWETMSGKLLAYDMETWLHGVLSLPPEIASSGALTKIHNQLSYVTLCHQSGNVFRIDSYGGMDMSLRLSVSLHLESSWRSGMDCKVLPCIQRDVVMFLVDHVIYSCRLRDHKVEVIRRGCVFPARYFPYVNSLAPVG